MSNNKEQKLLAEFPPVSTQEWEEVIAKDLKGADYEKRLVWKSAEGFSVRPYYRSEDFEKVGHIGTGIGEFPYVRSTGKCNRWLVHQTIDALDMGAANATALKAIAVGTEAIGFRIKSREFTAADLDTLMKGIDITQTEVTFTGRNVMQAAELMLAKAAKEGIDPEKARVNFAIDPIISRLSLKGAFGCCEDGSKCFADIKTLVTKGSEYKKMRFVGVAGHQFHNSGSTIVQELAFSLAAGHEYLVRLMEAGLTADQAAGAIRFSMAVSANYFMEIAKFRAARMLWANIVKAYKPECDCSEKILAHAVTSKWNLTAYDPYVNMLRGTTEAMSASIAGIHSLEVLPFDAAYEAPTEFSARIARNVQLLLKNESHFDSVVDPSGGSYYIEHLTQSIADQAWKLFREVEDKGGYIAAFKSGFIPEAVAASAAAKDKNIATRREILLGTNQYPNFTEVADQAITCGTVTRGTCDCGCPDCGCDCGCGDDCKCGEGGECTCGDDCKCREGGECTCGDDCKCGEECNCAEGGECTCGCDCGCDECTCGCDCEGAPKRLHPYRGAMAFEAMRLKVDRSGREPKAFMLTAGTLAMARARSQFSSNFFGCAGIRVIDNNFFQSVEEGVKAALKSGSEIVVLCAADDDYAELAPAAHKLLGDKAILVVAGAPASQPELEAQGITHFISVKSNVLETLKSYLKELGI